MSNLPRLGRILVLPIFVVMLWLPLPLPPLQQRLLALLLSVVCLWITEALPIAATAMLIGPALVVLGITEPKIAFAPYADPLLFLFYGAFFIAAAMQRHGLDRRIALAIVGMRIVGGVPQRARAAMMLAGLLLSMWISNTATTAILVPILLGMLKGPAFDGLTPERQQHARVGGLLAIAYACSVGGMGTLVGTPPNLITARMLKEVDVDLTFVDFSLIGVPTALVLALIIYSQMAKQYPAPSDLQSTSATAPTKTEWTRGEKATAVCLGSAIAGFILPPVADAIGIPGADTVAKLLPAPAVAMLAAGLLFWLRDEKKLPLLPWPDALRVDWGLIMLFGGGISLGSQMFATGLAETLGRGFIELTGVTDLWTLTALAILFTIFFTEVCSNTATANMVLPLVLGVTTELHLPPAAPALGVGLAASCAFMMPIATGPNAIAYGTNYVPLQTMVRAGFLLNILTGIALFLLLRVLCPLYGLSE